MKITFDDPIETPSEDMLSISLTEGAARRIGKILDKKEHADKKYLRVKVEGGGCSGFSYQFKLVSEKDPSDISIQNENVDGVEVLIDMVSFNYLKGSTLDFEDTLEAAQFVIKNPNAKSSCGCGNSFSL